ncbi:hypothetical protein HU200_060099 [Digitaria exilis]|uniref:Plant heme peroxidase family profile domain-containing protein n=1 Tax=Digitaria exilis TaxID=1010633 RepID=A0A835A742_9POAL|nr:hypothetical protein HU200_060099 [Digitaria exilis]
MAIKSCLLLLPLALLLLGGSLPPAVAQLEVGYYSKTCPNAEAIVRNEMKNHLRRAQPRRRDGKVSSATEAADQLPPAFADIPLLTKIFASNGLDVKDLAVLSGAHTLGTAHCPSYASRLYDFSGAHSADPSLDSEYADRLRTRCKSVGDTATLSEMDPGSYRTFDTSYYRNVAKRRGLFQSDAALLTDVNTREYVQRIATGKFDDVFFKDFGESNGQDGQRWRDHRC